MSSLKSFKRGDSWRRIANPSTWLSHRISFTKTQIRVIVASISTIVLVVTGFVIQQAATATSNTFDVYLDEPFVQNSYIYRDNPSHSSLNTFDNIPGDGVPCNSSLDGGAVLTVNDGGACVTYNVRVFSGSSDSAATAVPVIGGQGSSSAAVGGTGATIQFNSPQTYMGIWWSAGSPGNQIDFYNGNTLVTSMTTSELDSKLRDPYTPIHGGDYAQELYLGHPLYWGTTGTPTNYAQTDANNKYIQIGTTAEETAAANEPFVFAHFFASGNTTFDKVVLSGNGFEFDNLVFSDMQSYQIDPRLEFFKSLAQANVVTFDSNGGQGSMAQQSAAEPTPLSSIGYISGWYYQEHIYRPGYDFNGWNTAADGTGTSYNDGETYSFGSNTTLFAQWQASTNTINYFDAEYSQNPPLNYVNFESGQPFTTDPAPSNPGFIFGGWYIWDNLTETFTRFSGASETLQPETYTPYLTQTGGPTTLDLSAHWILDTGSGTALQIDSVTLTDPVPGNTNFSAGWQGGVYDSAFSTMQGPASNNFEQWYKCSSAHDWTNTVIDPALTNPEPQDCQPITGATGTTFTGTSSENGFYIGFGIRLNDPSTSTDVFALQTSSTAFISASANLIATIPAVLPIDPRAKHITIPSVPITGSDNFTMCVDPADSGQNVLGSSNLLIEGFSGQFTRSGARTSEMRTGTITITADQNSAIAPQSSKYLRVKLVDGQNSPCTGGTDYFIELRPIGLNGNKKTQVQIQ